MVAIREYTVVVRQPHTGDEAGMEFFARKLGVAVIHGCGVDPEAFDLRERDLDDGRPDIQTLADQVIEGTVISAPVQDDAAVETEVRTPEELREPDGDDAPVVEAEDESQELEDLDASGVEAGDDAAVEAALAAQEEREGSRA